MQQINRQGESYLHTRSPKYGKVLHHYFSPLFTALQRRFGVGSVRFDQAAEPALRESAVRRGLHHREQRIHLGDRQAA